MDLCALQDLICGIPVSKVHIRKYRVAAVRWKIAFSVLLGGGDSLKKAKFPEKQCNGKEGGLKWTPHAHVADPSDLAD